MAGGNRVITDTVSGATGYRMRADKDRGGRTEVSYTSGHVVKWEKTEQGDGKRLREVRTVISVDSPHVWGGSINWTDAEQHDRIFKKGKYAEATNEGETNNV